MPDRSRIAVAPASMPEMHEALRDACTAAGAEVVDLPSASALIFADPHAADSFPELIGTGEAVEWVQLPYAGIESFTGHLDHRRVWTCGKGVYAPPVAEWVVTALLTAFRDMPRYIRAKSWPRQGGRNLLGAKLTVVGGGGIAESLLALLAPWQCDITIVRRRAAPLPGASRTVTIDRLTEAVTDRDAVIVALPLTPETIGLIDRQLLDHMSPDTWLLNVGRGGHVVTADLVEALSSGTIAGAVLDVTDPEPLPDDHPLWDLPNCVVTPHVGNTPEMGLPLLAERVRLNVERWINGEDLIGKVDVDLGY